MLDQVNAVISSYGVNAVQVERRLLGIESVHECKVIRRQLSDGPENLVAYVVPVASVHADRIGEWLAALKKQVTDYTDCDFVALSRLPLTGDGQVDEAELLRLPVLDDELARRSEDRLRALPDVKDAMVVVEAEQALLPLFHYSELFSEQARAATPAPNTVSGIPASTERRLAISHGEELRGTGGLPCSLGETLHRAALEHPDHGLRTIDIDGTERFLAYPELLRRAQFLTNGLRAAGLHPGDRIILQFRHNQDFLIAFWGCCLGGFVPVPLAASYTGMNGAAAKLQNAWKTVDARLVLTTHEMAPGIRALAEDPSEMRVACVEELLTTEVPGERPGCETHNCQSGDVALMMLTSGSTGQPKGVMLSHSNLIRRSAGSAQMNGFSSDMVTLNWMPLDHVAGIVYFHLRDVFLGCQQIHAATDLVSQDPLIWMDWIHRYRATATFAPNFAFGLLNDRAEDIVARANESAGTWDLSCLRYILNGAEAIVPRTARRFLQLLAPYGLSSSAMWPVWGMSETSSGTTYSDSFRLESSHDHDSFVEVGRPIPGISLRIVDQNEQPIVEGEIGSLHVKGEVITAGYFNRPDLNAESFTKDGWFKTGDLGFLLNGRLTITGREKDVIVINSVNYPCHEIEGLVEEIEGVETSYTAACAVRDPGMNTDQLAIFFHPTAGCDTVSGDLIKTIRGAVSRRLGVSPQYLLPVERASIPKTNIGKIQRTQLAKSFAQGEFAEVVRRVEVLTGGANTVPNWFFRPVWRRSELRGRRDVGPMLVLAGSLGLGECLQRKAIAAGYECVLIAPGKELSIETLAQQDFEPQSIVYLRAYRENPSEDLEKAQESGALSVLRLVQALGTSPAAMRLMVVGNQALENAPLLGLLKTIPQENPKLSCCHIELPIADNDENAARILRELSAQTRDTEIAYRDGNRWVRKLERADLAAEPAAPMPIEKGGLYLLSGGLGGLGLELARYLIEQFQAHVLLVGRTKLDVDSGDRSAAMRSLEALAGTSGGSAAYATLDVGDLTALRETVRLAEEQSSRTLNGVFHLAGIYHESPISDETATGLAAILHPKLKGTWALHQLVEQRPGALFVSFSSVNGFFGGYGVGAYSAANSFLEAFSEYQRTSTHLNAYCLSWSVWDDVGMSRGYVMKNAARARGFYAISPRQGLASLRAVLQRPPSHTLLGLDGSNLNVRRVAVDLSLPAQSLVALVNGDLSSSGMTIPDRYGVPALCRVRGMSLAAMGATEARGGPVAPEGELESTIASVWRKVLNVEQLGVTDNFFDLGGSSLAMGQANRLLQEVLKRKISMTEMFQYPAVRALAAHLAEPGKTGCAPELNQSQSRGEQRRQMARALSRRRAS